MIGEPGVSLIVPSRFRYARPLLPLSGSLGPRFPAFPVPDAFRNHRYYDRLRPPDALLAALCLSLALRYHTCSPVSLVRHGKLVTDAVDLFSRFPPGLSTWKHQTLSSSRVIPLCACPALTTPVVSLSLAIALRGLLPSDASIRRLWLRCFGVILLSTTIRISGLNDTACKLVPPGFAPFLTETHAGFATDLLAKL